jgi:molybdenum cofactor biosynthesis MoaF-like protein
MKIRTLGMTACLLAASLFHTSIASAQEAVDAHAVDTVAPGEFPAAGHSFDVDFGKQKFRLDFKSETELTFTSPDGKNTQTVPIVVTKIRPGVFMVFWSRKAGQYVVHVDDFEKGVAYSSIFLPDGSVQRLKGTLVAIK